MSKIENLEKIKKIASNFADIIVSDVEKAKKYVASPIPSRENRPPYKKARVEEAAKQADADEFAFVEIEMGEVQAYSSIKIPDRNQKIMMSEKPQKSLFYEMRLLGRNSIPYGDYSRIFMAQAKLMENFEDDYEDTVPFISFFSNYQQMTDDQLRTYFTWRKKVRNNEINKVSTSYAFLYIYELINQIGVESADDGLQKLIAFWQQFREFDKVLDKYVLTWIKDYHIYYEVNQSFNDFIYKYGLITKFPHVFCYESSQKDSLEIFSSISKYDIKKSKFFTPENEKIINDCFYYIISKIRLIFEKTDELFEDLIYFPLPRFRTWIPFNRAIFHRLPSYIDKTVIISKREIYECREYWKCSGTIFSENGKSLIGYIIKEMEVNLRKILKFKYKINANINDVDKTNLRKFQELGINDLQKFIEVAVLEFYKDLTRTEVKVDFGNLGRIRHEAFETQEKLIVPVDEEAPPLPLSMAKIDSPIAEEECFAVNSIWEGFNKALSAVEKEALKLILYDGDIREFARSRMIMLEVLVEGINDKAADIVGDAIMDFDVEIEVFDDYIDELRKLF